MSESTHKISRTRIALIVVIIVAALGAGVAAALWPDAMSTVDLGMTLLLAIGMSAYAVANVIAAIRNYRARRWGWCAFWLSLALLQMALVVAILDRLSQH
jgi:hypothetical protein